MARIFGKPEFIPKILDKAIINSDVHFPYALIDAHYVFFRESVFCEIKEKCGHVIIDPVTYCLQIPQLFKKKSFEKLPYSKIIDIQKILSDDTFRLNSLVVPTIDFQINNNSSSVIAPYLCTDDLNSALFAINRTLLGETLYILNGRKNYPPVFAPICIGANVLRDKVATNYIVDCYKDDSFYSKISGYFIMVTDFDDRLADEEQLLGLADIVYQLSQEKDVIVNHLGGFGDILSAISCSCFASSPGGGETFPWRQMLQEKTYSRGRDHEEWRYVPELFNYVNEAELVPEKINYQCSCHGCTHLDEYPTIYAARKAHFLNKKKEIIDEMEDKTREERANLMINKLESALRNAHEYIAKYGCALKTAHIIKWKKILEMSRDWNYQKDDDELERLLQELS